MDLGSLQVARNSARCHDSYLRSNGTCTFSPQFLVVTPQAARFSVRF